MKYNNYEFYPRKCKKKYPRKLNERKCKKNIQEN